MLNLSVNIERIDNGFIVTGDNPKNRTYYESLAEFVSATILEAARTEDDFFNTHDANGTEFDLIAKTTSKDGQIY